MEYKCNDCKKSYSSYQSLWIHNKKFHKDRNQCSGNIVVSSESKYLCQYCNKNFKDRSNKHKHEKKCKNKINVLDELKKLKEENELLKKNNQLVPLNNTTNSHNKKKINNTNNINNGTSNINNGTSNVNNTVNNNNNTVLINKIGTEPIVFKTKDIKKIANDGMNGPITCAQQLNFNKKKPQNHSYCVTSLEGEYCKAINHKTQQPEMVPKKEIIDQVFESAYRFIESVAAQIKEDDSLREKLTKKEIKEINRIVDNKNKFYEKNNRKTFYNSINSMGYNYKELVLTTWKLLKPLEENLVEDDNLSDTESEYDYTMKEVTEFPDPNESSDSDSDEEMTVLDLIK